MFPQPCLLYTSDTPLHRATSHKQRLGSDPGSALHGDALGPVSYTHLDVYKRQLFYILAGGVRLTTRTKNQPAAVTAILGVGDLFGELCLAGYPLRMSTAVALTASSIRTIKKAKMLQMLRKKNNKASNSLVAYLLSSVKKYQDHVAELLTSSAEQRLARVLLRLAHLDKSGPPLVEVPILSHQVLAEMVGTTRPRVNLFMNRFRKQDS